MDGLSQLVDGVGVADLSNRGRVLVVGADAAKLLNNLCTNDILKLQKGQWCEAFFLNAKGGVLFYARIFHQEQGFELELEPGLAPAIIKHLDRYIIRERVEVVDYAELAERFHVCGVGAQAAVEKEYGASFDRSELVKVWRNDRTPFIGFDVHVQGSKEYASITLPGRRDDPPADWIAPDEMDRLRILAGLPAFGREIVEGCLAQEIDRNEQAISFTKGCYIGQETVARLDAMGHVNKILRGLVMEGNERPAVGAKIVFNDKEVGSVSSSAVSLDDQSVKCLAIVRIAAATPGTQVMIDGRPAVVSALPFG